MRRNLSKPRPSRARTAALGAIVAVILFAVVPAVTAKADPLHKPLRPAHAAKPAKLAKTKHQRPQTLTIDEAAPEPTADAAPPEPTDNPTPVPVEQVEPATTVPAAEIADAPPVATATTMPDRLDGAGTGENANPIAPSYFGVIAVGGSLLADTSCASLVRRTGFEPRPANATPNATVIGALGVSVDGASATWNGANAGRITGAFTGTTDEIIQWGACKWGMDEDLTRARVFVESRWNQFQLGDPTADPGLCASMGQAAPCHQSFGVLQVKGTVHEGTYPASAQSTAWNVDYALAWQRACYEGAMGWLGNGYAAGDVWGCVGAWFSGRWWDAGARSYVDEVRTELAARRWETASW